jgi:hypothetical protein
MFDDFACGSHRVHTVVVKSASFYVGWSSLRKMELKAQVLQFVGIQSNVVQGREQVGTELTNAPTVQPAAIEGIEPVRA